MSFDPAFLFLSMVIGSVGLGLFIYGKKQGRWPQLVVGVTMLIYPYFTSTVDLLVGTALALVVALWWVLRLGW